MSLVQRNISENFIFQPTWKFSGINFAQNISDGQPRRGKLHFSIVSVDTQSRVNQVNCTLCPIANEKPPGGSSPVFSAVPSKDSQRVTPRFHIRKCHFTGRTYIDCYIVCSTITILLRCSLGYIPCMGSDPRNSRKFSPSVYTYVIN